MLDTYSTVHKLVAFITLLYDIILSVYNGSSWRNLVSEAVFEVGKQLILSENAPFQKQYITCDPHDIFGGQCR